MTSATAGATLVPHRDAIDPKFKWDLSAIFSDWDGWDAAYRELDQDGYIVAQRGRGTFPAAERLTTPGDKQDILQMIYDKAIGEAARHGIGAADVVRYFRKVKP